MSPGHQMIKHTLCVRGIYSAVLGQQVKNRFILPRYQHLIMKAFPCTEKLKVLSFLSYQCSGWLHVFTDFNSKHKSDAEMSVSTLESLMV